MVAPGTTTDRDRGLPINRLPEEPMLIILSGRLILEDGTSPATAVAVAAKCGETSAREGLSDKRGRFSLSVPAPPGAGRSIGAGQADCEVHVLSPGYRAAAVELHGRRPMDNPDIGTIVLHPAEDVQGTMVSISSLAAPKDARKALEKAGKLSHGQKWDAARKQLEKALGLYPKYALAWYELGLLHQRTGRMDDARRAYAEAVSIDAKFLRPWLQLAEIGFRERRWPEVADTTEHVLKLNPYDFVGIYQYSAIANFQIGKLEVAEQRARQAVKLDTRRRYPKAEHVLGVILAHKRDYAGAVAHMKLYLQYEPRARDAEAVRKQIAQLEVAASPAPPRE